MNRKTKTMGKRTNWSLCVNSDLFGRGGKADPKPFTVTTHLITNQLVLDGTPTSDLRFSCFTKEKKKNSWEQIVVPKFFLDVTKHRQMAQRVSFTTKRGSFFFRSALVHRHSSLSTEQSRKTDYEGNLKRRREKRKISGKCSWPDIVAKTVECHSRKNAKQRARHDRPHKRMSHKQWHDRRVTLSSLSLHGR